MHIFVDLEHVATTSISMSQKVKSVEAEIFAAAEEMLDSIMKTVCCKFVLKYERLDPEVLSIGRSSCSLAQEYPIGSMF